MIIYGLNYIIIKDYTCIAVGYIKDLFVNWIMEILENIDNILDMGLMLSDKQLKKLQEIDDKLCRLEKNE